MLLALEMVLLARTPSYLLTIMAGDLPKDSKNLLKGKR